ncbi:MAG: ABC transporter ATP-binding protein [Pseudomonadota bacterium]
MFSYFEKLLEPFPETPDAAPPKGLFPFTWHYVKDAKWLLIGVMTAASIAAIGEVALFGILGAVIDSLRETEPKEVLSVHGPTFVLMGLFVFLVMPVNAWFYGLMLHQSVLGNLASAMRWRMHRRILGQSISFFSDEFAGRVSTKVMQTALATREVATKLVDILVYVCVYFLSTVVLVAIADPRLSIPMALWIAAYGVLCWYFVPRLGKLSQRQADARSAMAGRVVDSYTNIATVKLFAHAGAEEEYGREGMRDFLKTVHPQMRMVTLFDTLVNLNNAVGIVLMAAIAIALWSNGIITVGAIAAALGLVLRLNGMSHWIMWEVASLFENIGVVYDGQAILTKDQSVVDKPGARTVDTVRGDIQFNDVSFHYGKGKGVIEDLSLNVRAGEKIGVVGRSGAGKSTLVNLLLRLYDTERGAIEIDGIDISDMSQSALRSQIGVVTQDTSLLHRSIRENIAYGRPGATDDDVMAAIKRANALEFVEGLEDKNGHRGLDALVGERGVRLSGGQRQRIAIARVFLKDAPILVLDEATSALDSEVEMAIQENLFQLMEGKTVIAIAHRLSTIAALDRLIVLDAGKIVEQGTHADLVEQGGLYSFLWERQSGGFLTEPTSKAPTAA